MSIGIWQRGKDEKIKKLETQEAFVQVTSKIQFVLTSFTVKEPFLWVVSIFMAFVAIT